MEVGILVKNGGRRALDLRTTMDGDDIHVHHCMVVDMVQALDLLNFGVRIIKHCLFIVAEATATIGANSSSILAIESIAVVSVVLLKYALAVMEYKAGDDE